MDRRVFLKISTVSGCVFAVTPTMLILDGCNQATLASLVSAIGDAVAQIAQIEGNSSLATKLETDAAAAASQVLNWTSGSVSTMVIEALNLVTDDLQIFPLSSEAISLIDLALGTVEAIIAQVTAKSPASTTPAITAHALKVRAVSLYKPPSSAREFKKQWKARIGSDPALQKYALK